MKIPTLLKTLSVVTLFALTACDPSNSKAEIYKDNPTHQDGTLTFTFDKPTESFLQSNFFTMYMYVISSDTKPQDFTFSQPKIIKEDNQAEYSVGCLEILPITLECDVKRSIRFTSTLPTLTKDANYTFEFEYNKSKKISFHLYDKPSSDTQPSESISTKK